MVMNAEQRELVACIDAFVEGLVQVIDGVIRERVAIELERQKGQPAAKARGAGRRPVRGAASQGPTAQRSRGGRKASAPNKEPSKQERRPKAERAEGRRAGRQQSAEPAAAPLFVYKRAKDGRIERLSRREDEADGDAPSSGEILVQA
jgi:hypothetical protein